MTVPRTALWFVAALIITVALYATGLSGGFLFDDFPNIVDNSALHVTESTRAAWLQAAWASPSSDLQRPLASLSFAANHYFTGLAPRPMKVTNLVIHLLNGLLLHALLRGLLQISGAASGTAPGRAERLALLVTAAWLLHPINLSAVLFVVQRMESLAQLFVLLGLLLYVQAREHQAVRQSGSMWRLWIGVPICTALGVAAKESAALLPLFALAIEGTALRGLRRPGRELAIYFSLFLIVPGVLGLIWLLPGALSDSAYAHRAFTLGQRLMTEPRVLLEYAIWTVLPAPGFFSFYHDDYPISLGLLTPWSTLPALLGITAMSALAWWLRGRRPLTALGIAWFLAAHVLTASVFPLELVFEHRNYFASIGLLLAVFDGLLPEQPHAGFPLARHTAIGGILALATISLGLRAHMWADPVRFAVTEAARHPQSPRASYNLGRTYVLLSGYRTDSPNLPRAIAALESAARVPRASLLPEAALIMVASRTGQAIDPRWWDSMRDKLVQRAPTPEDAAAIKSLTLCQREGHCALDDRRMLEIYLAASERDTTDPAILYSYAIFAYNRLHDKALALRLVRDAAKSRDVQYQLNLVNFLIDLRDRSAGAAELQILRQRAKPGSMDVAIADAQRRLALISSGGQ